MENTFQTDTERVLLKCAAWLEENAESLASSFADGCKHWSIRFSAGEDGMFPVVTVTIDRKNMYVVGEYHNL